MAGVKNVEPYFVNYRHNYLINLLQSNMSNSIKIMNGISDNSPLKPIIKLIIEIRKKDKDI